jgi:uncharacterized protein with PIN domain
VIESMSNSAQLGEITENTSRFAADRMLGRLVKWLRVLGQDVIYGPHLSGYGLIRAARAENRLILTRDRHLKQKQPPPYIYLESERLEDQLRQLSRDCGLKWGDRLFSRCLVCNSVLQSRAKDTVEKLVPPYVYSSQERFSWCPACQRIYWPATHQQKMLEALVKFTVP